MTPYYQDDLVTISEEDAMSPLPADIRAGLQGLRDRLDRRALCDHNELSYGWPVELERAVDHLLLVLQDIDDSYHASPEHHVSAIDLLAIMYEGRKLRWMRAQRPRA